MVIVRMKLLLEIQWNSVICNVPFNLHFRLYIYLIKSAQPFIISVDIVDNNKFRNHPPSSIHCFLEKNKNHPT